MNKKIALFSVTALLLTLTSCEKGPKEVTIVFTNDIHSYVGNVDSENNPALRLSKIKSYVDDLKSSGKNTLLIDAGDMVQGNIYGGYDNGSSVIDIMNSAGYDLAVPGNHDFDYDVPTFLDLTNQANFPFISCNFVSLPDNQRIFDATKIFSFNNVKIGFVGITTPDTLTTSTPTFFQDKDGNWIYDFIGSSDENLLYSVTQEAIDSIRNKVDYVVAIGHLGISSLAIENGISSIDVINNTNGIDLFIDAHSHDLIEDRLIKNKNNEDIPLVQAGCYLTHYGVATFNENKSISIEIKDNYDTSDIATKKLEDSLINNVDSLMGIQLANNESEFYIYNPDDSNQRLIRSREMNTGDFVADSFYWYLNEYKKLDCDVVIQNGGGIRTGITQGRITYKNLKDVGPFNNVACLIEATGQEIKDAIEMGVTVLDEWNEQRNGPSENGGFLQVAGIKYSVDCNVPSNVSLDDKGMFVKVNGEYRAKDIQVYDKNSNNYVDLDLNKTYRVGGISYILRNSGNGLSMFSDNKLVVDYLDTDFQVLCYYASNFTKVDDFPLINTVNSPLYKYTNYQIDYANPYGANRISILNLPY